MWYRVAVLVDIDTEFHSLKVLTFLAKKLRLIGFKDMINSECEVYALHEDKK